MRLEALVNQYLMTRKSFLHNAFLGNLQRVLSRYGLEENADYTMEELHTLPRLEDYYPDLGGEMDSTSMKMLSICDPFVYCYRVLYWYHPDYLGNVELITDHDGEVYEFLMYSPWGENLYEWRNGTSPSSFSSPYRFNGKELDPETGLHYYGARYYANKTSIWLSVDPLAEKYPNMSAYAFTGNNPVMLVDPDGRDLWIIGESAEKATSELQKTTNALILSRNSETGEVSYVLREGVKVNDADQRIMAVIDDQKSHVTVDATSSKLTYNGNALVGGSFMGGAYNQENDVVKTWNMVNPDMTSIADEASSFMPGSSVLHEVTEGHEAAKYMLDNKITHAPPAAGNGQDNTVYMEAHRRATPQFAKYFIEYLDKNGVKLDPANYGNAVKMNAYTRSKMRGRQRIELRTWP